MLYYAVVFFIIAIIAGIFGFGGIAAGAVGIAKILFFVFLVLAVVFMPAMGISGAGLAFFLGQSAVAMVAFATQIVPLLRGGQPTLATPDMSGRRLPEEAQ